MQLKEVRVIVTGGASGLDLAAARYLAGKGAKLAPLERGRLPFRKGKLNLKTHRAAPDC
jgi:NAD(P)-dependent dehydrogenase (short-subunit alcohol dehydrogenase family)